MRGSSPLRSSPEPRDPLRRALALAARGRATVAPNPCVGAVLTRDGRIVGAGFHRRAGEAHAEALALRQAGDAARGATLYVTLEPCAHHGRTPPCTDAVIAAGVARVVACHRDPDPRTGGRGFAALAAAGVELAVGGHAMAAIDLNLPYLVRTLLGRPAVTLKWAASLDGKIATVGGESRWITGEGARRASLGLREEHDAILIGIGTALADDPRLTRRLGRADGPILRVVLDRGARLPAGARMFVEPGPVVVYTESRDDGRCERLRTAGAEVVRLDAVDPASVLDELGRRGAASVLVEGGAAVLGAFVDAGLWDRAEVFVAPRVVGGERAPSAIAGRGLVPLANAAALDRVEVRRRGPDLWIRGTNRACLQDLSSKVGA